MEQEPKVEPREAQHYVGVRDRVTLDDMGTKVPPLFGEVCGWVGSRGIPFAAPPFLRFHVIDMERSLEIEVGVPVATAQEGDGRIQPGVLPAGQYVSLIYQGQPGSRIGANAALQKWAEEQGIIFDKSEQADGSHWGCRYESELTNPDEEPNMDLWEVDIAYRIAD